MPLGYLRLSSKVFKQGSRKQGSQDKQARFPPEPGSQADARQGSQALPSKVSANAAFPKIIDCPFEGGCAQRWLRPFSEATTTSYAGGWVFKIRRPQLRLKNQERGGATFGKQIQKEFFWPHPSQFQVVAQAEPEAAAEPKMLKTSGASP